VTLATARHRWMAAHALRLLWRNRLRSLLVVMSAALGVSGVVCASNYVDAGNRQLLEQVRRLGANLISVTPRQSRVVAGRVRSGTIVTTLNDGDYAIIRRRLPTLSRSSAIVTGSFRAANGDLSKTVTIVGCEPGYFGIRDWPIQSGAPFDAVDTRSMDRVALIGQTVARDLFGTEPAAGRQLRIDRVPFTVIGVLSERGQGLDVGNDDDQIYVPLTTAMHRLMNVDYYAGIILEILRIEQMDDAALQVATLLRQRHHLRPGQPDDFLIGNQKRLIDDRRAAAGRLRSLVNSVAASTLVLSSGGIAGIALISVRQRNREIGTRRALGATMDDVFGQMLFETATLATLGISVGIGLAYVGSAAIALWSRLPFVFNPGDALLAASHVRLPPRPPRRHARSDCGTA